MKWLREGENHEVVEASGIEVVRLGMQVFGDWFCEGMDYELVSREVVPPGLIPGRIYRWRR